MVTVEGVARTINPRHDIWKSADPVVRRWIIRELSPPARIGRLVPEGTDLLRLLKRRLEEEPTAAAVVAPRRGRAWPVLWFGLGAAAAGLGFIVALW
jgi:ubiquinone biosynthesis protein